MGDLRTFRKTVGTLLDEAGLTARQIADVLGHSHPSMTLNTYLGRGQESRASAEARDALKPSTGAHENCQQSGSEPAKSKAPGL